MENQSNFSFSESAELELGLFELGQQLGEYIKAIMEQKNISLGEEGNVYITMHQLGFLTAKMKRDSLFSKLGSQKFLDSANGAVSITGMGTTAFSTKNYFKANNLAARVCYAGGAVFGSCGMVTSGISCLNHLCQFNSFGLLSTGASGVFLCLGNSFNKAGLIFEGRRGEAAKLVNKLKIWRRTPNSGNIAFVMPQDIELIGISGQQVVWFIGIGFSVYAYGKMIVKSYQYGQQIISKKKRTHISKKLNQQSIYLIYCFNDCESVIQYKKIYNLAIG